MTMFVFDAAALIALERNDVEMWTLLREFARRNIEVVVPSTVISQVWRGTRRQASLARALASCSVAPFDMMARAIGELCGRAKTSDICDAHVALVGSLRADGIYTGDPDDIGHLLDHCGAGAVPLLRC